MAETNTHTHIHNKIILYSIKGFILSVKISAWNIMHSIEIWIDQKKKKV